MPLSQVVESFRLAIASEGAMHEGKDKRDRLGRGWYLAAYNDKGEKVGSHEERVSCFTVECYGNLFDARL